VDEEERKFGVQRCRDISYSQGRCASGCQQGKTRLLALACVLTVLHDLIQQEQHERDSAYEEHTGRHCCWIYLPTRGVFSSFVQLVWHIQEWHASQKTKGPGSSRTPPRYHAKTQGHLEISM
jgi:hypothetical protein